MKKNMRKSKILFSLLAFLFLAVPAYAEKMLILKGTSSRLDVKSAEAYAIRLGYEPYVLNVSGETGPGNPQAMAALDIIRRDPSITAIYGFSGGGYNARRIFNSLSLEEKKRLKQIDVLGSPGVTKADFFGIRAVNIVPNSPKGHMDTPRWWLENYGNIQRPKSLANPGIIHR